MPAHNCYCSTIFLCVIFIITVAAYVWKYMCRPRRWTLPGPSGIPLFGNLHQVWGSKPFVTFTEWAKLHGDLFHLKLGSQDAIVINSIDIAKEALVRHGKTFAGRPDFYTSKCFKWHATLDVRYWIIGSVHSWLGDQMLSLYVLNYNNYNLLSVVACHNIAVYNHDTNTIYIQVYVYLLCTIINCLLCIIKLFWHAHINFCFTKLQCQYFTKMRENSFLEFTTITWSRCTGRRFYLTCANVFKRRPSSYETRLIRWRWTFSQRILWNKHWTWGTSPLFQIHICYWVK